MEQRAAQHGWSGIWWVCSSHHKHWQHQVHVELGNTRHWTVTLCRHAYVSAIEYKGACQFLHIGYNMLFNAPHVHSWLWNLFTDYVRSQFQHVSKSTLVDCINDKCANYRRKQWLIWFMAWLSSKLFFSKNHLSDDWDAHLYSITIKANHSFSLSFCHFKCFSW